MLIFLATLLATVPSIVRSRAALELENLALRQQIGVLQRSARKRPKLILLDRLLWAWLSRVWSDWRSALAIVQPETVLAWHRRGFGLFWAWKIRRGQPERPTLPRDVRDLIRRMCRENPTWGAPRIQVFADAALCNVDAQLEQFTIGESCSAIGLHGRLH
jgi:putative transposase